MTSSCGEDSVRNPKPVFGVFAFSVCTGFSGRFGTNSTQILYYYTIIFFTGELKIFYSAGNSQTVCRESTKRELKKNAYERYCLIY